MSSPVFDAMFFGKMIEGTATINQQPISLPDLTPSSFKDLLQWVFPIVILLIILLILDNIINKMILERDIWLYRRIERTKFWSEILSINSTHSSYNNLKFSAQTDASFSRYVTFSPKSILWVFLWNVIDFFVVFNISGREHPFWIKISDQNSFLSIFL